MRYNVTINQPKCIEHGLTISEGALMDLLNQLSSWADVKVLNGVSFYHLSRNKVVIELPFFFKTPDTVYRSYKNLFSKGLVDYTKQGKKDLIRLSKKGKTWNKFGNESEFISNSEMNPSKFGNESEKGILQSCDAATGNLVLNSEMNPTYNNNTTNDKREARAHFFLSLNFPVRWEIFEMKNKNQIDNYEKFLNDFDSTCDVEELKFNDRVLFGRIEKFASNWIYNTKKGLRVNFNSKVEVLDSHPSRKKIAY